jgi:hypothetical protein
VVVVVDEMTPETLHALEYAFTIGPRRVRAVHFEDGQRTADLREAWRRAGLRAPLEVVPCRIAERARCLRDYVARRQAGDRTVTVVLAGPARTSVLERARLARRWRSLEGALRGLPEVSVVVVRERTPRTTAASLAGLRPMPTHRVVILAGRLDRSVLKAIRYAKSIDATEIRAVHAAVDPRAAQVLLERWTEVGPSLGIPLDVEECFDRDIVRSVRMSVDRSRDGVSQVTVILPRRVFPRVLQRALHDHTARTLARAFETTADVEVVLVPYRFGAPPPEEDSAPGEPVGDRTERAAEVPGPSHRPPAPVPEPGPEPEPVGTR